MPTLIVDQNETLPQGKYVDSYGGVSALIVNDDNHRPYVTLPRINSNAYPPHPSGSLAINDIDAFVVPLYDKIHLPVDSVASEVLNILDDPEIGLKAVGTDLNPDDVVVRIFLTPSTPYRRHWSRLSSHPLSRIYRPWPMHQFIWVAELSTRGLYPSDQVVGEIIFDATASAADPRPYTVIHYPGKLFLNMRQTSRMEETDLPPSDPYPAYRGNLAEVH